MAHLYVFYVSWRLWEAHLYVFDVSRKLWEADLYVFYVSGRLLGVPPRTNLSDRVGPLKKDLTRAGGGERSGSFVRVLRVLEALGGSFVRVLRVREAPGGARFAGANIPSRSPS